MFDQYSTSTPANRSMPPGVIIPELGYRDLDAAVGWLSKVFGFQPRLKIRNHRVQLLVGPAAMVAYRLALDSDLDGNNLVEPAQKKPEACAVMVRVADVDSHYEFVQQRGAKVIVPPADYPYGERQYTVEDIGGHRWTFSQAIEDVDPAEWGGEMLADIEQR